MLTGLSGLVIVMMTAIATIATMVSQTIHVFRMKASFLKPVNQITLIK
jgi:hypothetical protein